MDNMVGIRSYAATGVFAPEDIPVAFKLAGGNDGEDGLAGSDKLCAITGA